jgi:hypothetical protein
MYELIDSDLQIGIRLGKNDNIASFPLSLKSQMALKELYNYLDASRSALDSIRAEIALLDPAPDCPASRRVSEQLQKFCIEADSWRFEALCELSMALQFLVIDSRGRVWGDDFWKALYNGLATLSSVLDQCEMEFRWRLTVADMLERLN